MAFPRLNNISFWRALLWILIGSSLVKYQGGMTHNSDTLLLGTMVVAIPYKLNDLPDAEMDRGPEHVIKAMNESWEKVYDSLQSTVLHDFPNYCTWGNYENPIGPNNTDIIVSSLSGQSKDGATTITLRPSQVKRCTGSKKYTAYKESTTGFPKGSKPYGNGALILMS